ncbi:SDR family NAD(P)-dependent oxidoreductase [Micromonospora sp. KLBMP9576]|uniref:SDR family NAD(P)-dependent oxidoreductase n=1 Tax=Micromonospora sp. KLBMP9576 TaxID=3424769 RepID=UPI003D93D88C
MTGGGETGREVVVRLRTGVPPPARVSPPPRDGRVALVSGGSRGLGLRVVERLAGLGMRVVMGSRSPERGRAALDLLGGLADRVAVRQLDVLDPASVERLTTWMEERLGRCDVLVSTAATSVPRGWDVTATDLSAVRAALETNVRGVRLLTQAVAPLMRRARYGRVVTMSSGQDGPAHRVSRRAVSALTRELADELAPHGILVNACCPGSTGRVPAGGRGAGHPFESETPVWLATLPDDGPTGSVFCTPAPRRR